MLQVKLTPGNDPKNLELRARESQDTVRGLYRYTIDIGGSGNVERARSALGSIGSGDVTGCAASFDDALRRNLDPRAALARALAARRLHRSLRARGAAPTRRSVARRRDSHGRRLGVPSRRSDRARRGGDARRRRPRASSRCCAPGCASSSRSRYRSEALRSLVAPEMDRASFAKALGAANAASCGANDGRRRRRSRLARLRPEPAVPREIVMSSPSRRSSRLRRRAHATLRSTAGDGPRERLDALGAEALSEAELIALLLRTGGARSRRARARRVAAAAASGSRGSRGDRGRRARLHAGRRAAPRARRSRRRSSWVAGSLRGGCVRAIRCAVPPTCSATFMRGCVTRVTSASWSCCSTVATG